MGGKFAGGSVLGVIVSAGKVIMKQYYESGR
jgi:hypothetical protein